MPNGNVKQIVADALGLIPDDKLNLGMLPVPVRAGLNFFLQGRSIKEVLVTQVQTMPDNFAEQLVEVAKKIVEAIEEHD